MNLRKANDVTRFENATLLYGQVPLQTPLAVKRRLTNYPTCTWDGVTHTFCAHGR